MFRYDKGTPVARPVRKARGLSKAAQPPYALFCLRGATLMRKHHFIALIAIMLVSMLAGASSAYAGKNTDTMLSTAAYGSASTGYCSVPYRKSGAERICDGTMCSAPYRKSGATLTCTGTICSAPYRKSGVGTVCSEAIAPPVVVVPGMYF